MKTTADYLDLLRAHFGVPSDYALEKHTGWQRQQTSKYRQGKSTFDDDTSAKVAAWLGVPLAQVLIDMSGQRARSEEVRRAWESVAAKAAAVFVFVMLAGALPGLPGAQLVAAAADVCILCKVSTAAPILLILIGLVSLLDTNNKKRGESWGAVAN